MFDLEISTWYIQQPRGHLIRNSAVPTRQKIIEERHRLRYPALYRSGGFSFSKTLPCYSRTASLSRTSPIEETVMAWVVPGKKQHDVYTPFPCIRSTEGSKVRGQYNVNSTRGSM